jgi:hypothetical protein
MGGVVSINGQMLIFLFSLRGKAKNRKEEQNRK